MFSTELTQKPKRKQCVYETTSKEDATKMKNIHFTNGIYGEIRKVNGIYKLYI